MCEHMNETIPPASADARPALALRAQYVKDLSFENPRAPGSLFSLREAPAMEVSINLGVQRLEEELFELSLHVSVRAIAEKTTIFLSDLVYAGLIETRNIPAEQLESTLYVQGAQLLFPYVRRVISDVTRDGGFPGLQLEPVDFMGLYLQQKNKQQAS
jgi:preprotein translocase subunit SecB